ncbi:hypothetical protein GW891_03270 [bacterium]|nr:hypothetical protein [bacterium]
MISTHQDDLISAAVTFHDLVLFNFNHSTQISLFDNTNPLRFNIISIIESFTHGRVEYS